MGGCLASSTSRRVFILRGVRELQQIMSRLDYFLIPLSCLSHMIGVRLYQVF